MKRIKVNTNFYLDEFVDPYTYFNSEDHGLSIIDKRLFDIAQLLRYHNKGPLYINTWWRMYEILKDKMSIDEIIKKIESTNSYYGRKIYKWSGNRIARANVGSSQSAHRSDIHGQCLAIDPKGDQNKLFKIVEANAEVFYSLGLRRLEDKSITPGWLHADTREHNTSPNSIRVVNRIKATEIITW